MEYEYQILARSRFTHKEIGMIEQSKSTNLKNINPQFPWNPFKTTIVPAKKSIKINRIFDRKLISSSIKPTLDQGLLLFISAQVSLPVYTTIPIMKPLEASTVFAHKVYSKLKPSDSSSVLLMNFPSNS